MVKIPESSQSRLPLPQPVVHVYSLHTDPFAQPGRGDAGGMNVYIARSIAAMLAADDTLRVEVFTLLTDPDCEHAKPGVQVPTLLNSYRDRMRVHQVLIPQALGARKNQLAEFTTEFAAQCVSLACWHPQVIHAHYWLSGVAALGAAQTYAAEGTVIPVVFTPHTTAAAKDARRSPDEPEEPHARYESEHRVLEHAALTIVNTSLEGQQLQDYYGADSARMRVIAPGVDTGIFHPLPGVHAEHEGSDTHARVVFAGRPQPLKGPHILVEALALLPADLHVELDIIGKSSSRYELDLLARARDLGIADRVHLHSPVPADILADIFRRADIVASPSSSESFGLVALEAQASGAAVLATDADGLRFAIENHKTGLLVAPRTPQRWAVAIERLVRAPRLRLTLGANAAARARSFSWEATARKTLCVYSEAITGRHLAQERAEGSA